LFYWPKGLGPDKGIVLKRAEAERFWKYASNINHERWEMTHKEYAARLSEV